MVVNWQIPCRFCKFLDARLVSGREMTAMATPSSRESARDNRPDAKRGERLRTL